MSKKISIITINYNDKIGLKKTIQSVIGQTWKDIEFVIIDGGSSDGSTDIIKKYSNQIDYFISEKDNGVYNAMNKGIKVATGKYVLFLNGGDTFYDEKVLNNVEQKLNNDFGIIYGNSAFVKNEKLIKNSFPPSKLNFVFFFNSGLNHQATFIKKSLFDEVFYYNESYKICADWEFFMYAICVKRTSYLYLNKFICNFDLSGVSANNWDLYNLERDQSLRKFFPYLIDDFEGLKNLGDKRVKNMLYIKKFNIPWKLLKGFSKILILFLPKRTE